MKKKIKIELNSLLEKKRVSRLLTKISYIIVMLEIFNYFCLTFKHREILVGFII